MQGTNIILGYGETLTHGHTLKRGSGEKKYPYSIDEQRPWLGAQLTMLREANWAVPANAKPRGQNVVKITLHPTFLAKSHHPNTLLAATGLRCIGSRATTITPRKETRAKMEPAPSHTAVLFVAGSNQDFDHLGSLLQSPKTSKVHQQALCRLELITPFEGSEKNYLRHDASGEARLEVVLHAAADDKDIVGAFVDYVVSLGGKADTQRMLVVSGLTFMPVHLATEMVDALGLFQFVRVVRTMPSLRMGGKPMRAIGAPSVTLPNQPAIDQSLQVGIFDAGIGHSSLAPWVSEVILPGTESTTAECLGHGNGVTSTVLFGPLNKTTPFTRPYANVRHYRCIGPNVTEDQGVHDVDLYNVLLNIDSVLKTQPLDFVNFSLGPYMPIEDDEVHPWTALIDKHLASGNTFATVAVGNDGDKPWPLSRVQPPSDMVNALAVGACDSAAVDKWQRAPYSSFGPGRSPGLVKPDGVSFGGSDAEPFIVYNALAGQLMEVQGTSYSAPATMRTAIGIKASLTSPLNMLALRALMNHHASRAPVMAMSEVGHGRFPQTVEEVLQCPDNEVRVIYQGTLKAGQNMRALIPFPTIPLNGRVRLRATLVFASHTDPEHAVNYTRAGLTVLLRPKKNVSKTMAFFSASKMYTTELEARVGEHKWETTLRHEHDFNPTTLNDPLFDITYGAREDGQAVDNSTLPPLPYSMVVTVAVENTPGIYNNIRQRYQTLLPVEIRQEVRIQATGQGG